MSSLSLSQVCNIYHHVVLHVIVQSYHSGDAFICLDEPVGLTQSYWLVLAASIRFRFQCCQAKGVNMMCLVLLLLQVPLPTPDTTTTPACVPLLTSTRPGCWLTWHTSADWWQQVGGSRVALGIGAIAAKGDLAAV
jgi:hypothetical protein